MNIRDDSPQVEEIAPQEHVTNGSLSSGNIDATLERSIGIALGLEKESEFSKYADKIHTLLEYAKKESPDHTPENIKWVIRSLELKLGSPPFAEKRINHVARYAYLLSEESRIAKEKEAYIRAGN